MNTKTKFEVPANFELWLTNKEKLSKKVARDTISRLKRISTHVEYDLDTAVMDQESFTDLLHKVRAYSYNSAISQKSAYALNATLRISLRKYALFRNPKKAKKYLNLYSK